MSLARARLRMVREQLVGRGIADPRVLDAMATVERHDFVDAALSEHAYDDKPLPIGEDQTISQPYMVALMTEALELVGEERVLEVGTGCGYQTAVLALLCRRVYSVERLPALAEPARVRLEGAGYRNVTLRTGDGSLGWPEEAPFEAVLVTAGTPTIPRPLIAQMTDGARLVFPLGEEELQMLVRIRKDGDRLREECLGECRFVKLVGRYGWTQ